MPNQLDAAIGSAPVILCLPELQQAIAGIDLVALMEKAFVAATNGSVVSPSGGELLFRDPPGDAHIKYGYIEEGAHFVVKVVAGFYGVDGSSSTAGAVMVCRRTNGRVAAILLDDGWLTNVRTAAAGAVVAKYLAPRNVDSIGVIGTGLQARMQVQALAELIPCRGLVVWGRSPPNVERYLADMVKLGFHGRVAATPHDVAQATELIITATSSFHPLLRAEDIRPGTHITAIGADTDEKCELEPSLLSRAAILAVDSRTSAPHRGETALALRNGAIGLDRITEIGAIVSGLAACREHEDQITVADLGGIAAQDIFLAEAILQQLQLG